MLQKHCVFVIFTSYGYVLVCKDNPMFEYYEIVKKFSKRSFSGNFCETISWKRKFTEEDIRRVKIQKFNIL